MKRWMITPLAVLALWSAATPFAQAQSLIRQVPARPTGIGPGRMPMNATSGMWANLTNVNPNGTAQGGLDPMGTQTGTSVGLQTGHSATFFNTGNYFPISSPGSGLGLGRGAGYGAGLGGFGQGLGGYGQGLGMMGTGTGIGVGVGVGNTTPATRLFFPNTVTPGFRP